MFVKRTLFALKRGMVCIVAVLPITAQSQAYEKASIHPSGSSGTPGTRLQVEANGDLTARGVDVIALISYAYDVPSNPSPRLTGVPDWAIRERYDIEATASGDAFPSGISDRDAQDRLRRMLRQMLTDRFGLSMQAEDRRMPVYSLRVAESGPILQKASVSTKNCIFDTAPGGCHAFVIGFGHPLKANAVSMDDLARYIENWTDLPVVNQTSLSGLFTLDTGGWRPMHLPPPPPNGVGSVNFASLPTISTVLSRLGLELDRQEESLPVYTVEHIDRPTTN